MSRLQIDNDNKYGQTILSNQQLGREIRNWKWISVGVGAALVASNIFLAISSADLHKPLLLDTRTGNIVTDYKHVLDEYTVEERSTLARLAYEGLRRRTGIVSVDGEQLSEWSNHITKSAVTAWKNLGDRWGNPSVVEYDFQRTINVLSVVPDRSTPYAFVVEALESDAMKDNPRSEKTYRVRLTLYFTDPKVDGQSKIDGVTLHSEELVK